MNQTAFFCSETIGIGWITHVSNPEKYYVPCRSRRRQILTRSRSYFLRDTAWKICTVSQTRSRVYPKFLIFVKTKRFQTAVTLAHKGRARLNANAGCTPLLCDQKTRDHMSLNPGWHYHGCYITGMKITVEGKVQFPVHTKTDILEVFFELMYLFITNHHHYQKQLRGMPGPVAGDTVKTINTSAPREAWQWTSSASGRHPTSCGQSFYTNQWNPWCDNKQNGMRNLVLKVV